MTDRMPATLKQSLAAAAERDTYERDRALAMIGVSLMARVTVEELGRLLAHFERLGDPFRVEQEIISDEIGRR